MGRNVAYWVTTGLIALMSLFGAFEYLRASPEAVAGFAHVGYPQQLRVLLGIAKLAGASPSWRQGFSREGIGYAVLRSRGSRRRLRTTWRAI